MVTERKNRGTGAIQIGHVGGNLTIVQITRQWASRPRVRANSEQRDVLRQISGLPDEAVALDFMHREFGTRMVVDLGPEQLYRVRKYVEAVSRRTGKATQ